MKGDFMSKTKRRQHSSTFKAKVALEAVKELETLSKLASRYSIHTNQITRWKKQLKDGAPSIFESLSSTDRSQEQLISQLYERIGQLQMELNWLKKKL
jgi:transposase-like protein